MTRVLRPGGAVIWYDGSYPNPWNRHLRSVTKRQIRRLVPSSRMALESTTLLPLPARRLGRTSDRA